jgi:hypothetical protein
VALAYCVRLANELHAAPALAMPYRDLRPWPAMSGCCPHAVAKCLRGMSLLSEHGLECLLNVNSYPQLGWLAPQAEPVAQNAPETITLVAPAAPAAPSLDQQPLSAISLDLDAVRQSVDRIAAGQEQMTRNVDQLAAAQEQTTREISKLQAIGQYILYKNSEPPPPQAPFQVSTPRQSQARTPR